jgi:O-antigen ligase
LNDKLAWRRASRSEAHRFLFWPFLILVLLAPAALGANRPLFWSALAFALGLLLLLWAYAALRNPGLAPVAFVRLAPVALPFILAIAWAFLQSVSWIPEALKDPTWHEAGAALGRNLPGSISLAPEEAGTGIMRLLSYGTVLFLALQFGYSTHCRRSVLWGVAAAGALYALYGILVWLDGNTSVLWMAKWAYPDSLTSTFVNRNSYATYAGLGLCAALALIARGWKEGGLRGNAFMLALALAVPIAAALLLARSRGGAISALIAILAMALLVAISPKARIARTAFACCAAALILAGLAVVGAGLIGRLDPSGIEQFGGRVRIWVSAISAIGGRPLGGGLGAFPYFFPGYRDATVGPEFGMIDKAHNTYLELAAELGVPMTAALVIGLGWLVVRMVRANPRLEPGAALAAVGASILVAVHSLFDFGLEIPAITVTWLLLLGAGLGQVEHHSGRRSASPHRRGTGHRVAARLRGSPKLSVVAKDH